MIYDFKNIYNLTFQVSLYPWCNFTGPYPVKHPKIIRPEPMKVDWTHPDDVQYEGLIKCKIIAPKGLYLPVLPFRIPDDQRLLFPLCVKCAQKFKTEHTICFEEYSCPHKDEDRFFTTTITVRLLNNQHFLLTL